MYPTWLSYVGLTFKPVGLIANVAILLYYNVRIKIVNNIVNGLGPESHELGLSLFQTLSGRIIYPLVSFR
mgnify:CR=1 FL=1